MAVDLITGSILCVVVLLVFWLLTRRPSGLPLGPTRLPLLGNVLSLDADPRVAFNKLRRQYGDIFSVYLFHKPIIVLNGYEVLKEALVKNGDVFSHRPHSLITDLIGKEKGVVSTSGATWKEQRRFALSTLRDLGMGKLILEDKIQEELSVFLKILEDEKGQPFDCSPILLNSVSNILGSVMFGKRFEYTDPLFQRLIKCLQVIVTDLGTTNILNTFPILRFLPGDLFKIKRVLNSFETVNEEIIHPMIDQHVKTIDESRDDFVTAYIKEMELRQKQDPGTSMNNENLQQAIQDLFLAGSETTSTTLRWALVYFQNFPDVQEKCFQEIKENIGLNRPPSMKDKTSLPYLEATIMEVLRRADIAPTSVPHTVSQDVEFHGYTFPKGITVIPMLNSVLQDPQIWGDPETFRPDRFLDDGGKFKKVEEFIPFSLGRRVCPGESLARMELFLFLASMIQRYEFVTASGVKPPLEGIMGFTHSPKPFKVRAKLRC